MRRIYLDSASTAPLRPAARVAMREWLDRGIVGDPSRMHTDALEARAAVEQAREQVAALVDARPSEVVFTSGATEAIAMVSYGAARSRGGHTVLAPVEHSAVRSWAERGATSMADVDGMGRIDPSELAALVGSDTGLVQCQWANHEVGTIQPVQEVVELVREAADRVDSRPVVASDGAIAVGHVPVSFRLSGLDALAISGHKFGGPPGSGALVVRRGVRLDPLIVGGDQERARRGGMESVIDIVGFGAAAADVRSTFNEERRHARELTEQIIKWARQADGVSVFGDSHDRVDHLVCLGIEGVEPQPVVLGLDALGISVHSGSSCSSEALEPSPVLEAMGVDAHRSLRVSVSLTTTIDEVAEFCRATAVLSERLRVLGG